MADQWEMMNKRLVDLEERTRQKLDKLESELAEKDNIILQLNTELAQLKAKTSMESTSEDTRNILKEYEAQIANFDKIKDKYLTEITELNQKINELQNSIQNSAGDLDKIQDIEEQLGVFQELITQLEAEKRDLERELEALKEKQDSSTEEKEQLGVFQELVKQLEAEKRDLERELEALKEKQDSSTEEKEQLGVFQELIIQLEAEKRDLEKALQNLKANESSLAEKENEIQKLNVLNSQLHEEKIDLEAKITDLQKKFDEKTRMMEKTKESDLSQLEEENKILLQRIKTMENQIKTQTSAQQQLDQTIQMANELKQHNNTLQAENKKFKKEIEKLNIEIDELIKTNRKQNVKIQKLEAKIGSATEPTIARVKPPTLQPTPSTTVSKPKSVGKRNFGFINGNFVETTEKSEGINLELDENAQKWILIIEPGVGFLEKNNALRMAHSLTVSGLKAPDGNRIGKGYELIIHGEY